MAGDIKDQGHVADRCIMVIFGASGDLTTRKLLPALYNLARNNLLPKEFAIIGFAIHALAAHMAPVALGPGLAVISP